MLLYVLVAIGLVGITGVRDPAASLVRPKSASRQLECERLDVEGGARARPGSVAPAAPRGDYFQRSAMLCQERVLRAGLRSSRDEAVLSTLSEQAFELAAAATSRHPELAGHTWLVEAHYGDPAVEDKLAFATKNALAEQGLAVSDRRPTLSAGDVAVLGRLSPDEAWPAACRRYRDAGHVGAGDALLAVLSRDRRETLLHAGTCTTGGWTWLR